MRIFDTEKKKEILLIIDAVIELSNIKFKEDLLKIYLKKITF